MLAAALVLVPATSWPDAMTGQMIGQIEGPSQAAVTIIEAWDFA